MRTGVLRILFLFSLLFSVSCFVFYCFWVTKYESAGFFDYNGQVLSVPRYMKFRNSVIGKCMTSSNQSVKGSCPSDLKRRNGRFC